MSDDVWIDFDGDGTGDEYDTIEMDDGSTQYVHYDEDGEVDAVAIDEDGDGIIDSMAVDSDGDGTLDTMLSDDTGDGFMDSEEELDQPFTAGESESDDGMATYPAEGFIGGDLVAGPDDGEPDPGFDIGGDISPYAAG